MKRDLTLLGRHARAVKRLVKVGDILLQGLQRVGFFDLDGDRCGAVGRTLDLHLHGAEITRLEVDRDLALRARRQMHAGNRLGQLRGGRR